MARISACCAAKLTTCSKRWQGSAASWIRASRRSPRSRSIEIKVDLDAALASGVKPGDVRRAAATLLAGIEVGNLFEEQKLFQVVVWGVPQLRHSLAAIQNLLIDTPNGGHVRLGDVASIQIVSAPDVIRRENVARHVDVVANISGRGLDAVAADVRNRIQGMHFPIEYHAELQGGFAEHSWPDSGSCGLQSPPPLASCSSSKQHSAPGAWRAPSS